MKDMTRDQRIQGRRGSDTQTCTADATDDLTAAAREILRESNLLRRLARFQALDDAAIDKVLARCALETFHGVGDCTSSATEP